MAQMTKSVRMRGMNLLHFVLMVAVMTIVWLTMYSPSIEPQTAQITTTAVLLCYLVPPTSRPILLLLDKEAIEV